MFVNCKFIDSLILYISIHLLNIQKVLSDIINNTNWEFVVAILAMITGIYSIYSQIRYNRLTFKPIPVILKYNFNNRVKVLFWNKGNGPLFIKSFKIAQKHSLIDVVPLETRKLTYVNFISTVVGRVISPSENLNLLEFMIKLDETGKPIEAYETALSKIKESINGLVISIEYTNIYGNKYHYSCEKLDFGNLVKESDSMRKIRGKQEKRAREKMGKTKENTSLIKDLFNRK
jgi:hypothetical protein